jgi:signal transduction histidine kinase
MSLRRRWTSTVLALLVAFAAIEIVLSRQINLFGAGYAADGWLTNSYSRSARIFHQHLERRLSGEAQLLSQFPAVVGAALGGDRARLAAEVERRLAPLGAAEFWFVVSGAGADVAGASGSCPCDPPSLAAAARDLGGAGHRILLCGATPALVVATPVGEAGAPRAWLGLGYRLEGDYVDGLKGMSSTEVSLLGPGGVLSTTLVDTERRRVTAHLDAETVQGVMGAGGIYVAERRIAVPGYAGYDGVLTRFDPEFDVYLLSGPIEEGAGGLPLRLVFMVPVPLMTVGVKYSTLTLIGATAVMLALLAFLLRRLIAGMTRPMDALVSAADRVAAGNLRAEVPVPEPRELATLATAFNKMVRGLSEAQAQLVTSQKMAAVGQLAAGLAHEINNPLTVIIGFAQGMEKRVPEGSDLRLPVTSIAREARRCHTLVQEILAYSRATGKHRPVAPVGVGAAVSAVLPLLEVRARDQKIAIKTEIEGDLPEILSSHGRVEQILVNLCNNAMDAMPGGGTLTLRARRRGPEKVRLEVEDTGEGIPEEIRSRIVEPFFTTKEVGKGTGLGLTLVYGFLQQQGGTLEVESQVGRGTTMIIEWPVHPSKGTANADPRPTVERTASAAGASGAEAEGAGGGGDEE